LRENSLWISLWSPSVSDLSYIFLQVRSNQRKNKSKATKPALKENTVWGETVTYTLRESLQVLGQPLKGQGQDEMPINEGNADF
jgi:hypothetical protein